MSLFSPAIQSLRDLQRASTLDKVRKWLGVTRASLGFLSESVAIFDPAPLKEIAAELGHTISSKVPGRFATVGQPITAVDGTVIETVKRVAELAWTPLAGGKRLSAYRLHAHFEVLSGKAVRIDATSANPKGDADERAALERTVGDVVWAIPTHAGRHLILIKFAAKCPSSKTAHPVPKTIAIPGLFP